MNRLQGFVIGAIVGFGVWVGSIRVPKEWALWIILLGFIITAFQVTKRHSLISPFGDGMVSGFCWIWAGMSIALSG